MLSRAKRRAIRGALEGLDKALTPILTNEGFAGKKDVVEAYRWLKIPGTPYELHISSSLKELRYKVAVCHRLRDDKSVMQALNTLTRVLGEEEPGEQQILEKSKVHIQAVRSVKRIIKAGREFERTRPGRRPE